MKIFIILALMFTCQALDAKPKALEINTVLSSEAIAKLKVSTIEVTDPVASTSKKKVVTKYKAYDGREVLDQAFGGRSKWTNSSKIGFKCADGYQAIYPTSDFKAGKFHFAFERADGKEFTEHSQSKNGKKVKLAPYYIVWTDKAFQNKGKEHYWPYQVVGLYLR